MPTTPVITKPGAEKALPLIPFTRASFQHVEPFLDVSNAISANSVLIGPTDVPSYGFMRHIFVAVTASGGTGTAAVYKEDAPFSAIQELSLQDVNGGQIWGPASGFDLYLANKYGGYSGFSDPKSMPSYAAPTSGNFGFSLRVPCELGSRDGVGALDNMNSAQTYKLRIVQAAKADVFSIDPTGLPTVRIRAYLEAWATPSNTSIGGSPQATEPPARGTTQMWTKQVINAAQGFGTLKLARVGNPIRNLILVFRNVSDGLRSDANAPQDISQFLDSKPVVNASQGYFKQCMREKLIGQTNGPDTGVLVFDYTADFDGLYGGEMRDLWLQTIQSTRLEFQGTFVAAQTVTVLTNDVAVVGNPWL